MSIRNRFSSAFAFPLPHTNYSWGRKMVIQSGWIVLWYHLKYGGCLKTCRERRIKVEKGESVADFFTSKKKPQ